jgi:hypothetical protein
MLQPQLLQEIWISLAKQVKIEEMQTQGKQEWREKKRIGEKGYQYLLKIEKALIIETQQEKVVDF